MPKHLKKTPGPSFSTQKSPKTNPEPSKIPSFDMNLALEAALAKEDYLRALEIIDTAPRWMKKQPEFMLIRATVLMSLGDEQESLRILREVERKTPRFSAIYLPLTMLYMNRDWTASR